MQISHTIRQLKIALVALQGFQVLFLWLHDWDPLGSLNDIAARYRIMFGKTHSFLPQHNGLVPNTAHILLHLSSAATLILLLA